jgi:competence protein ComEC
MRLPAVAIVAAFACGIAIGLHPAVARNASSVFLLVILFSLAAVAILGGMLFVQLDHLFTATLASLLGWTLLGSLAACIAQQPRSADHILSVIEKDGLPLKTPLRWHGRLRDEPTHLPWAYGYDIELSGVEYEGALRPVRGGLRLSLAPPSETARPPDLHVGDEVTFVTEAKQPQVFRDEGAFDRRAYLAQQNIDLIGSLRAATLIERTGLANPTIGTILAKVRRKLREEIDQLYADKPETAAVLRAMLLGDRSFVDRAEAADFQKTGVFHVLVVAGLHVGALAFSLYWIGRKLRLSRLWTMFLMLTLLASYVAVVEQRAPVLRAALMAAIVALGGLFFRRPELLNSAALAALILLLAKPLALRNSSFQLTFVAMGCIAALALPWLEKTLEPYARALRGWRDVTRDAACEPRAIQFRIDLRSLAEWLAARMPARLNGPAGSIVAGGLALSFRIWELLVITLALQLGMLPLMAKDFHRISLSAPLANLAVVPLIGMVVPLGFLVLSFGLIFSAAGKLLAAPVSWLTTLLFDIVQWFAHFPRWSYRIPGPPIWLGALFFAVVVLLAFELRFDHRFKRSVIWGTRIIFVACVLTIAICPFAPVWSKGRLELTVIDVGQGDSLFVVTPGGKTLLIDGGGTFGGFSGHEEHNGIDPGEEAVSPYLWSRRFQKLDVVALTHAHQDHLGGLLAIAENFRVGELWIGREVSSSALAKLQEIARQRNISVEHELRGKSFNWDGLEGEFLWPEGSSQEVAASAKNNDSLVLRLHYGSETFLLPGDAEKQVEHTMLSENSAETLRADVLKVGHHGSKNSTTQEFLETVRPRFGIISAGEDNPYGHPSPELLDRLRRSGVQVLRTDQNGAVHILTDGTKLEITCFVGCPAANNTFVSAQTNPPDHQQNQKQK